MDSYFQDQQGNRMNENSLDEITSWIRQRGISQDPSYGSRQSEPIASTNQWSGYDNGDQYVTCNSLPSTISSAYGGQERSSFEGISMQQLDNFSAQVKAMAVRQEEAMRKSFEDMVTRKLDALQAQLDAMALRDDEKRKFFEAQVFQRFDALQAKLNEMNQCADQVGVTICRLVQGELTDTEESIVKRLEQRLKVCEERSIERFEECLGALEEKTIKQKKHDRCEQQADIDTVICQVKRLENRMEYEMRTLYDGMYKAQGYIESDSDDDCADRIHLFKELPGHIDESTQRDARDDNSEMRCDSNSQPLRGELNPTACTPTEEREDSVAAELPIHQEDTSSPPIIMPCYSCELACAPQVKACFGVLASSSLKEKPHEESSCEEIEHEVGCEVQERQGKKKRRVVAQVWIPRGTLEVMKVFNMTEINLGEKSCAPHKVKKRKRRRKASNPQSGVG